MPPTGDVPATRRRESSCDGRNCSYDDRDSPCGSTRSLAEPVEFLLAGTAGAGDPSLPTPTSLPPAQVGGGPATEASIMPE